MSTTKYCILKDHFDKLILGGYPKSTGFELIRNTYESSFNMNISLQDVYETKMINQTNPIKSIITLIGPDPEGDDEIPTGLIASNESDIHYITHYTNDIFRDDIDEEDASWYIENVFLTMQTIVSCDSMYKLKLMRNNPYILALYVYPFYFTYHHIRYALPHLLDNRIFLDIFEKYYADIKYAEEVIKSLNENEYTSDTELIYSIMTCKNTISYIY